MNESTDFDFDFDSNNISADGLSDGFFGCDTGRRTLSPHTIYAVVIALLLILSFIFDRIDIWFGM